MAIVHGKLADIQTIPATAGALYANPVGVTTYIKGISLFNSNSTAETVKIYVVPDASGALGTAAIANQALEITLSAVESLFLEFPADGAVLQDTNDSLQASTNTAGKVTIQLHGLKEV